MPWYQDTMEAEGKAVISASHVQNAIGGKYQWVITLSKGLINPETHEVEGIFFVDMNYSSIQELCTNVNLGSKSYLFIVGKKGKIIYHPKQQLLYSGMKTELIDEVLEYLGNDKPTQRILLNALDAKSVKEALSDLRPNKDFTGLRDSARARSQADWLIGMNLTRLYTLKARDSEVSEVLSVGRVQTPTLAMVVNRDNEITSFVPKPWWQVHALIEKEGVRFRAGWVPVEQYCDEEKRCINPQAARAVGQLCQQQGRRKRQNGYLAGREAGCYPRRVTGLRESDQCGSCQYFG